ncbi:MAG: CopG family transcriptional regulator [Euryarchaeota archaeon]|nr:CopG family transcriptional regulator [Euryarchaeota archaeon]MDE1835047.1 CopG family transcriptional regulator [Euryarchaeota archaeon]MDE1879318.1 CopG family transcriptional regulator [Euryarchaeota archaeon]MDE2044886.1 CopG family transcriptional regulator [Thermoplasmata archaeon]
MKLVRTRVPDAEYDALKERARRERRTLQEVIREALHTYLFPDRFVPSDPLFEIFPLKKGKGPKHWTSRDHDKHLYPVRR